MPEAAKSEEPLVCLLLVVSYLATTVISFIALCGNSWVAYDEGRRFSGLWNDCNKTSDDANSIHCDHIPISLAPGDLHVVRASYIIGHILWILGCVQRFITWKDRGKQSDRIVIVSAFVSSVFVLLSSLLYTLVFYDSEIASNPTQYPKPYFDSNHSLAFAAAAMMSFVGVLNVRHYMTLTRQDFCSLTRFKRCSLGRLCVLPLRCRRCCEKRVTPPESPAQATGGHQRQRSSSTDTRPSSPVIGISIVSGNSAGNSSINGTRSGTRASSTSARETAGSTQNARGGGRQNGTATANSDPIPGTSEHSDALSMMALPPSYEDVLRDRSSEESDAPPTYRDSHGRELVLSPPPGYSAKTGN